MGFLLNSPTALSIYKSEVNSPYFVDKSLLLKELFPLVDAGNKHICITRPRRFGKSIMAAMVASFFSRGMDSSFIFDSLNIAKDYKDSSKDVTIIPILENINYHDYMNKYEVIYINFIRYTNNIRSYSDFINPINRLLKDEVRECFPDVKFLENGTVSQDLSAVFLHTGKKFILVLDEWDCVFHKDFMSNDDRKDFINWLADLTKDTGYVALTYMTGVLPIAKYSSGSTINNFNEYTMAAQPKYSEYFGFSDAEVDMLYERYLKIENNPLIDREDLRLWYDGYYTASGIKLYNPRSVVLALTNNHLESYWTNTGPYDELSRYIVNDMDGLKKDIALMVAGEPVKANVEEFAATAMNLNTKDEVFSAMVVYGFLNYEKGKVHIPNKELMDEFSKTIQKRKDFGYVNRLALESDLMLQATLKGDTKTMEDILQFAHDTETPLLDYNNETELTAIVNLVYLSSRDTYRVEREDKAGEGYVDFIFYPKKSGDDGIILELKVDDTPEAAIGQIKNRNYALKFVGKLAEKEHYTGSVLLVGIGYNKKDKEHHCKVERLMIKDIKATEKKKPSTGRRL